MEEFVVQIINWGLERFPSLTALVAFMGMARVLIKPLMVFLDKVVETTPTPADDEFLRKMRESKIYKAIVFILDYVGSIKPPKKLKPKDKK